MFVEDELIPISALQHLFFCERQCALIHIEQTWNENLFTAEGRIMHERTHEQGQESRGKVRIERGLSLRSLRLGLIGKADVVEFHREEGVRWQPFPVEYKRGKPKADDCDKVQLCAQAMCLEEMLTVSITEGALFYGKTRHRFNVVFDEKLRKKTEETAMRVHELIASGVTPKPVYEKRCKSCSLMGQCLPQAMQKRRSVKSYLTRMTGTS
ncbi:MAG: CRISPR-associated protein Cas4 [Candidatus Omnitrophota bacterium]|nr:CRISPR-associated protein Cas4 [Candidatus Omnitrophota bacterium]